MTGSGEQPSERTGSKRLRFTMTRSIYVDVDADQAQHLLDADDFLDVCEAADRYQRVAAHGHHHVEADLCVEEWTDDDIGPYDVEPIDGVGREKYLWSARHFLMEARTELSRGRYREGRCPELDKVNAALSRLEDELRLMALEVERPDLAEVQAWRVDHPPLGHLNGRESS